MSSHGAVLTLALALSVVPLAARGGELSSEHESLYARAQRETGLPLPARPPTIHVTGREELRRLIGCAQCTPNGLQIAEDVYIDGTLDLSKAYDASILLHELVHYLQWSEAGPAKSCDEWRDRERQAIAVQTRVLARAGADTTRVRLSAQILLRACTAAPWSAPALATSAGPGGL